MIKYTMIGGIYLFSLSVNSPVIKEKTLFWRIILVIFSLITGAFSLSPAIVYFITSKAPLTEMPDNAFFYVLKGIFAISVVFAAVIFAVYKKATIVALPSFIGIITSIYPLMYKINAYKEYKSFIESFSMPADYTGYLVSIGIYTLYILLCLITLLYSLGLLPSNLILLVVSALTVTAVIFITIDRAKTVKFDIYNIYDILSFSYASVASLLPAFIATSTKKINSNKKDKKSRYQPKRMKI